MKLLTVDDSAVMRKIIADAGAVVGYETLEAENGEQALAILDEEIDEIALVLLDWNMPGMTGFEVLKEIKADRRLANVPVMMVTTESERENIVKAIQAGAVNYLTKPFSPEDLITRILQTTGEEG